ncbi:membrane dipeptidase [Paraburkholderia sp.]|uniref:dipeptidase n=1 Tax=Paraburkholderia sp. TaxID=1926495 RepID=UPI00239B75D4|nr:membrane dipeptidase [Paraburkholderia sp.]MDE1181882.1 membrane dipeptidase [Paraburkholderia sp.]
MNADTARVDTEFSLDDKIVINAMGGLSDPNQPPKQEADGATSDGGHLPADISLRGIADARLGGLTTTHITVGHVFGGTDPYGTTVAEVAQWTAEIAAHPDALLLVRSAADIRRAKAESKIGVMLGFQNLEMLGDDVSRVDQFAEAGVSVFQLTYNGPNALGGGSLTPGDTGLTRFGRDVIERLNARKVVVDLSHSAEQTCLDALDVATAPIAITHTGCRALTDLPRNKSDAELRRVAERGGFVGIYFMPFLAIGRNATGDDIVAHIEHAIDVCGEDCVGIGTDSSLTALDDMDAFRRNFAQEIDARRKAGISAAGEEADIMPFAIDMTGPRQLIDLANRLARRGHSERRIDGILGQNFLRYVGEIWGR